MSADHIDHAAEARRIVARTHSHGGEIQRMMSEAQLHATLALVEQQRIANLITALTSPDDVLGITWTTKVCDEMRAEIRKGLGL